MTTTIYAADTITACAACGRVRPDDGHDTCGLCGDVRVFPEPPLAGAFKNAAVISVAGAVLAVTMAALAIEWVIDHPSRVMVASVLLLIAVLVVGAEQ